MGTPPIKWGWTKLGTHPLGSVIGAVVGGEYALRVGGWDVSSVAEVGELIFVNDSVKQQVEPQELDCFIR